MFHSKNKRLLYSFGLFILVASTLILTVVIGSCKGKKEISDGERLAQSTAELVSHITSGIISPSDEIFVRFVHPVVKDKQIGSEIKKSVFSFSPEIQGVLRWKDNQTLAFQSHQKLPFRRKYKGTLNLKNLFPSLKKQESIVFQFEVSGREISRLSGDFELRNNNDPKVVIYTGTIVFTESVAFSNVKSSVRLLKEGRILPLQWQELRTGFEFSFFSPPIHRGDKAQNFLLQIHKKPLDLSDHIEKIFTLEPPQEFKLKEVDPLDQGKRPGLEIRFSDILDSRQDITGLVSVNPGVDITVKSIEKSIYVEGDFQFGQVYTLAVSGIRSKWGTYLSKGITTQVAFEDKKPEVVFLNNGVFLPSANQQKINFRTINVKNIRLNIKKVFESNLGQFLQTEQLKSQKQRNQDFNQYNINRVGITVVDRQLAVGEVKNRWLNQQLDLKKILKSEEKGLFLITLSFKKSDMLYSGLTKENRYYYGTEYYSNPNSSGYLWRHGRVYKALVLSDIGLTYKRGTGTHLVLATNILDSNPIKNVKISLKTFQNQLLATKFTDSDGQVLFSDIEEKVFYVEAEKGEQRSFIHPAEMAWNLSSFDIGGELLPPDEVRAFVYTERGVYRPGDPINLSLIARNQENTFPENHPVTLKIYNPKNQLMFNKTAKISKDGFNSFLFQGKEEDLTGNWKAKFLVGSKTFFHPLKIETVVPYRLKVNLEPDKSILNPEDTQLGLDLESKYLFGNPASFLAAEVGVTLRHREMRFPRFPGFDFSNEAMGFKSMITNIFQGKLDENGQTRIIWTLPPLKDVPSAISANVSAKVYEKGGRLTKNDLMVSINPYKYYVGIQKPVFRYGYGRVGDPIDINSILVNNNGQIVSGRTLNYSIYRNSRYWWWEYDSMDDFRIRYKKDTYTKLIKEGNIISKNVPVAIEFTPENSGEYFIEVKQGLQKGHVAGFFFSAYYWGDSPVGDDSAGTIVLKTDRKVYHPGDTAVVSFPSPDRGLIHMTVEKANKILNSTVQKCRAEVSETRVSIPITSEMLPNVYVSVSIMQPHDQTLNDRPLRMYGIIPLMVEDPLTKQNISINIPDELSSNQDFTVEIRTSDRKPTQFTVAIVDEGLLDLTRFESPDPWKYFFKKQRLGVKTYDLYSYIIGAHKGDIFKLFSIGGEMEADDRSGYQKESREKKRFKAVSMFQGPQMTDEQGYARLSFKMPNYIGSVRVMVASARNGCYGMAEKTVPVKTDLMVLPTLPRVIGPEDKFSVPVTVFALKPSVKKVVASISVQGPVEILGNEKQILNFKEPGDQDVSFRLKAFPAVGTAEITIMAVSGRLKTTQKTNIQIRSYSPRVYSSEIKECVPNEKVEFIIPGRGIPGTNQVVISIMRKKKLNLNHRLYWLIHYPYGCVEQTVSSVFPQLYLKEFINQQTEDTDMIDTHINEAINRLLRFQTASGGFSFWPGGNQVNIWGTNYAGHFLIEAKKRGYAIPENLLSGWIRFQKSMALTTRDSLLERIYRLYGLALAGEAEIGAMNLVRENSFKEMTNTEKWILAATYFLAGNREVAKNIANSADVTVKEYPDPGISYGSFLRDKAIILEMTTLFADWNRADNLYEEVSAEISSDAWYSTQTLGYALLALGKYIDANRGDFREEKPLMKGYIKLPGKKKIDFQTETLKYSLSVSDGYGKSAEIFIDKETNLKRVFVVLEWNGIPLKPDIDDIEKNLWLSVEWMNEDGQSIDPASIKQGTAFWAHFRVGPVEYRQRRLKEMALVQILPSGWEIENTRLQKEDLPQWMNGWVLNREDYVDIRDDRIMWFFDLPWNQKYCDFAVKLMAVTIGDFELPPTLFEAMYNKDFRAVKKGGKIRVSER
jgi:uncharacterized protein YfaS (alpha-2-macroglobulin family)